MLPLKTKLFIIDDHPLVREWLGNLLRMQQEFEVIGEAADAAGALAAMCVRPPDVAIVDLTLNRGSGLDLIKDIRVQLPAVRIVVLSMHEELVDAERALRAGAMGYVMKRESTGQIVAAIHQVLAGKIYANPDLLAKLAQRMFQQTPGTEGATPEDLSDRELDVFRRLGDGRSTKHIAEELGVSVKTVQTYCSRIKEKLSLVDGTELILTAVRWRESKRS